MGKNLPASAGGAGPVPGLVPGLERSLKEKMAARSSILALRIPWTEEPHLILGGNLSDMEVTLPIQLCYLNSLLYINKKIFN